MPRNSARAAEPPAQKARKGWSQESLLGFQRRTLVLHPLRDQFLEGAQGAISAWPVFPTLLDERTNALELLHWFLLEP